LRVVRDRPVKLVRERLDAAGVAAHLAELVTSAQDIEVRIKGVVAHYSDATTDSLEAVGRRLLAGEIVAVQIRFSQAGEWWSDTVMRVKDDYRLVRMREGA
jgi:hypothetical protein